MIFSQEQTYELLKIIRFQHAYYIGEALGVDVLTSEDISLLKGFGIDPKIMTDLPPAEQAFHFGRITSALTNYQAKAINYNDFKKFLMSGGHVPMTAYEKDVLQAVKKQSYTAIKGLGEQAVADVSSKINGEEQRRRAKYEDIVRSKAVETVENRKSLTNMMLEIGAATQDWERKLGRIVETEMHNAYEEGRATEIERDDGHEVIVYKDVYAGACKHCIQHYLTNGIGSEPIKFKMSELRANGTNIGRKAADWKAVLGAMHPYCFDKETEVLTNSGWKYFKDVVGDELILSVDLDTGDADWVGIKEKVRYKYKGKMHHLRSNKFDKMVTPDHMSVMKTRKNEAWRLRRTEELPKKSQFMRSIPSWVTKSPEFPMFGEDGIRDDFVEFLGFYLSEGSISKHKSGYQVKISQSKHLEYMAEVSKRLFINVWVGKDAIWIPVDEQVADFFMSMGRSSKSKRIPELIMLSDKKTILHFLKAFALGDGTTRTRECFGKYTSIEVCYYTSSVFMEAQLGELILKSGGTPSYSVNENPVYNDKEREKIYESNGAVYTIRHNSGRPSHKEFMAEKLIDYDDYVYDVELEKWHTLITRRNGKVVVSGNCRCTVNKVPKGYKWDSEKRSFSVVDEGFKRQSQAHTKAPIKVTIGSKEYVV